jgi:hypothetical protein
MQPLLTQSVTATLLLIGFVLQSSGLAMESGLRWCHNRQEICQTGHSSTISCASESKTDSASRCCASELQSANCCSEGLNSDCQSCRCCTDLTEPPVAPTSRIVELSSDTWLTASFETVSRAPRTVLLRVLDARPPPLSTHSTLCVWLI